MEKAVPAEFLPVMQLWMLKAQSLSQMELCHLNSRCSISSHLQFSLFSRPPHKRKDEILCNLLVLSAPCQSLLFWYNVKELLTEVIHCLYSHTGSSLCKTAQRIPNTETGLLGLGTEGEMNKMVRERDRNSCRLFQFLSLAVLPFFRSWTVLSPLRVTFCTAKKCTQHSWTGRDSNPSLCKSDVAVLWDLSCRFGVCPVASGRL